MTHTYEEYASIGEGILRQCHEDDGHAADQHNTANEEGNLDAWYADNGEAGTDQSKGQMVSDQDSYRSQAARDAAAASYSQGYCEYLDESAQRHYDIYMEMGQPEKAQQMLTRTLSQALMGNDGD